MILIKTKEILINNCLQNLDVNLKLNLEFVLEKLNNFKYQKQIEIFQTNIIE